MSTSFPWLLWHRELSKCMRKQHLTWLLSCSVKRVHRRRDTVIHRVRWGNVRLNCLCLCWRDILKRQLFFPGRDLISTHEVWFPHSFHSHCSALLCLLLTSRPPIVLLLWSLSDLCLLFCWGRVTLSWLPCVAFKSVLTQSVSNVCPALTYLYSQPGLYLALGWTFAAGECLVVI